MQKKSLAELTCMSCSHKWIPRKEEVRQCPKCRTFDWYNKKPKIKIDKTKCSKCGHEWNKRKDNVLKCPKCGTLL